MFVMWLEMTTSYHWMELTIHFSIYVALLCVNKFYIPETILGTLVVMIS